MKEIEKLKKENKSLKKALKKFIQYKKDTLEASIKVLNYEKKHREKILKLGIKRDAYGPIMRKEIKKEIDQIEDELDEVNKELSQLKKGIKQYG